MAEHQVLEERYVDKAKLVRLLKRLFPNGGFEVEVSCSFRGLNVALEAALRLLHC